MEKNNKEEYEININQINTIRRNRFVFWMSFAVVFLVAIIGKTLPRFSESMAGIAFDLLE